MIGNRFGMQLFGVFDGTISLSVVTCGRDNHDSEQHDSVTQESQDIPELGSQRKRCGQV